LVKWFDNIELSRSSVQKLTEAKVDRLELAVVLCLSLPYFGVWHGDAGRKRVQRNLSERFSVVPADDVKPMETRAE